MLAILFPYALAITAAASGALGHYVWRRRPSPGALALVGVLTSVAVWAFGYALELTQHSLGAILFWTRVEYIGIAALSPFWLIFAMEYTGHERWLRPRRIAALFVIPLISLLLLFSSSAHTLFYRSLSLEQRGPLTLLVIERGIWSWVTVAYSYVLLLIGFHLVSLLMLRTTPKHRPQVVVVMLGMLMPFAANVVYMFGWLGELEHLDITPFALTLTGVTVVLALFRYRLFDLLPLARDALWTSLQGGVLVLDGMGRIVEINPAAERLLRVGKWVIGQYAADALREWPSLAALCADPRDGAVEFDGPDKEMFLEAHCSILRNPGRPPLGSLLVIFDASARKQSENRRLDMERQLLHVQRLESLGVLAGGIAHDFNNLLTGIIGNVDLALLSGLPKDSPLREALREAKTAAQRATTLTEQMLAYSGRGKFVVKALDLSAVVGEISSLLRSSISKKIALDLQLDPALPSVEADPGQLQQIAMNLIINAAECYGAGAGKVQVRTGARAFSAEELASSRLDEKPAPGHFVYLEVTDQGPGIASEAQARLFEPFYTTKFAGRGLGLAAVLGIVRGHRGALMVESQVGQGSTFRVLLPASSERPAAPQETGIAEEPVAIEATLSGVVLVVDDEEVVRETASRALEQMGLRALRAAGGASGVALLSAHPEVDVVLLDLTMPGMDGLTTLREMRKLRPELYVILSSGFNAQDEAQRLADNGATSFIKKPYELTELRRVMERAIKK